MQENIAKVLERRDQLDNLMDRAQALESNVCWATFNFIIVVVLTGGTGAGFDTITEEIGLENCEVKRKLLISCYHQCVSLWVVVSIVYR